jgi:hydroxymethylbilane synthase
MRTVRIGTRGSRLAKWQAEWVQSKLMAAGVKAELVVIQTLGDQQLETALYQMGSKGLFTKALDEALISNEIDLAVHSTKDIPTEFEDSLELGIILKREDPRDVLVGLREEVHFENLNQSFKIGTSSLRRQALIHHYFPGHTLLDVRGNLDTRIEKLKNGLYDGLVLAYAGVKRLGLNSFIRQKFNVNVITPAVAQGAIGVIYRKSDDDQMIWKEILNDVTTFTEILAERAFLRKMEAGCHAPVFGLATLTGNLLSIDAGIASIDGKNLIRQSLDGLAVDAEFLGTSVAESVLALGGKSMLHGIKN